MKRCSLFSVLLLFVFVVMVLLFNSSNCYALSSEDVINYIDDTADYFSSNSNYQSIKSNSHKNYVVNFIEQYSSSFNNFACFKDGTYYQYKFFNASNGVINGTTQGLTYSGTYTAMLCSNSSVTWTHSNRTETNSSIDGGNSYDRVFNKENTLTGMSYITQEISGSTPLTWVGMQAIPQFVYLEFVNDVENSAYNGSTYTYYIKGDFYDSDKIKIGHIIPNDSYYYELRLKDSVSGIVKGTSFVALNTSPYTFYNDGGIYVDDNNNVYVIPRLLKFSKQYQLEITSYYGDGGDNLYEDIDWFIFLPFNAIVSGDYILSLGSGDYTTQDSTNDIMGFLGNYTSPSGDIQGIINSDGSLLSGDLFDGVNMPVLDGMKNYNLFDLLRAIGDCVGGSGDAYFDFQMHGETPTRIYSSQFRTPDGALKTFVSSFLVFFTFYFLVLQLRHVLEMLTTANIKGAIDYVDSSMDNMFYM